MNPVHFFIEGKFILSLYSSPNKRNAAYSLSGELQSPRSHAPRGNGLFGRSASVMPQVQGEALVSNSFDAERRNIAFPRRAWERGFFALCSSPDIPYGSK